MFKIELIDSVTGRPLPVYTNGRERRFGGIEGQRFKLRLTTPRGRKFKAVTSLDGLNVISREVSAGGSNEQAWVVDGSTTINGWYESESHVAEFVISAAEYSTAALTGQDTGNKGVAGARFFAEKLRPVYRGTTRGGLESLGGGDSFSFGTKGVNQSAGAGYGNDIHSQSRTVSFEVDESFNPVTVTEGFALITALEANGWYLETASGPGNAFPAEKKPEPVTGSPYRR